MSKGYHTRTFIITNFYMSDYIKHCAIMKYGNSGYLNSISDYY